MAQYVPVHLSPILHEEGGQAVHDLHHYENKLNGCKRVETITDHMLFLSHALDAFFMSGIIVTFQVRLPSILTCVSRPPEGLIRAIARF